MARTDPTPADQLVYSADGLYLWDGTDWQLAGSAPPRGWRRPSLWARLRTAAFGPRLPPPPRAEDPTR